MTSPTDELRTAATALRDLATRTRTTLERHELQWTDLTTWAGPGQISPMVWSQYAAAMHPAVGGLLAELLETAADYVADDSPTHPTHLVHALAVARAVNGHPPGPAV
ncbi:hypothetical protein [Streptomyces adelaidensis]|uniref:hypothetical protein n=1 Tax=Streptomyces adelaidensis TaxID=2796465 RepID=UPI001906C41D|nr:hypothetical protein [Streptomyces adelaidensis]